MNNYVYERTVAAVDIIRHMDRRVDEEFNLLKNQNKKNAKLAYDAWKALVVVCFQMIKEAEDTFVMFNVMMQMPDVTKAYGTTLSTIMLAMLNEKLGE